MKTKHDTEHLRIDDTGYTVKCVECGKEFTSTRNDAAFCSSTCRSKAHRREKTRQREIDLMLQYVVKVCDNMKKRGDSPEFDALNKAIKYIAQAVNRVESK